MPKTKWQKEHPERCRELAREWRKKNHEHILELKRRYRERHRRELSQKQLEYYYRVGKVKAIHRRGRLKVMFVEMLGGICQKCGYDKYFGCLEFHHINPEDKKKEKCWRDSPKAFEKLVRGGKIILLCNRCHREKHLELSKTGKFGD